VYAQPTSFAPSALRHPVRLHLQSELAAALDAAKAAPADLDAQFRLAKLQDQADDPAAEEQWRTVLGLVEAQLRRKPEPALLERQVEALIGANLGVRVVPPAEKLTAARGGDWRAQLLLGDAYLRRADFNWHVLVQTIRGAKAVSSPQLIQMNGDLAASEKAYARAMELAPAEPAPRAGRIALSLARPVMASLLPKGAVAGPDRPDLVAITKDLVELVSRNPDKVEPLWHTVHFLALQPAGEVRLSDEERKLLAGTAARLRGEGSGKVLLPEARGLWAVVERDWDTARGQFELAAAADPERRFAADWLALAELNSREPKPQVVARLRARIAAKPRAQDQVALAILTAEDDRRAAVAELRKAVSSDLDHAGARYNLAVLLAREDVTSPEVRHHLLRTLALQPDHREALFALAVIEALDGDTAAAQRALGQLDSSPDLDADLRGRVQTTLKELLPAPAR
jgi:tetratricopeptide (TPR) repeat protein